MSAVEHSDGSEDVQEFLKRIRELSEKREQEDNERTRKLEEEILEGRRQREARRLGNRRNRENDERQD
jgi:DNA integrity scanning protein DisA with diadenylate cyclase activity